MENNTFAKHPTFYAVGLSYKKADAEMRGKFSLDEQAKTNLLHQAKGEGIDSLIVTSTCNRTEIYGFAQHPFQLIKLLCENSQGTVEDFQKVAFVYKNSEAISHMFRVGTGLDSQILGDFEIISQLKNAFVKSKEFDLANAFLERLVNAVIQASKKIKNETEISSGATSVSFASVQYIFKNVEDIASKNILLFGTGKIGRNTCENLVKHTKHEQITLINRTKEKAEKLAKKLDVIVKDYADLQIELQKADVVVVATGAQNPTVDKAILNLKKPLLILDLSIPKNVNENVKDIEGVTLVHMDELSQITDETLENRKKHIPAAEAIIQEIEDDLNFEISETYIQIESVSFKEKNKWKFSNGKFFFNANITDEDFLAKIDSGELRFGKGDILKVKLKTVQTIAHNKLKSDYEVIKVIEHKIIKKEQENLGI